MNDNAVKWLWMQQLFGIGSRKAHEAYHRYGSPQEILSTPLSRIENDSFFSDEEKARALAISRLIKSVKIGKSVKAEKRRIAKGLEKASLKVDYVEFVDGETLQEVTKTEKGVCVLVAAYCGKTRLIDNRVI